MIVTDFTPHLLAGEPGYWEFRFPNGQGATVELDVEHRFHFLLTTSLPATMSHLGGTTPNLTTEQVEAKLAEVMALPAAEVQA